MLIILTQIVHCALCIVKEKSRQAFFLNTFTFPPGHRRRQAPQVPRHVS